LHGLDPADVGDCLDNQHYAPNGDAFQATRKGTLVWRKADNCLTVNGLMVWRKADNWTASA